MALFRRFVAIVWLVLATAPWMDAAGITVRGTVTDASGAPVAGAAVVLMTAERTALVSAKTDAQGQFSVVAPSPGSYLLAVRASAFDQSQVAVLLTSAEPPPLAIVLEVGGFREEVTVTAAREVVGELRLAGQPVNIVDEAEIASRVKQSSLTVGGDTYFGGLTSVATNVNPVTGAVSPRRPRIPDGADYTHGGVYAQTAADVVPDRVRLAGSLRYGGAKCSASAADSPVVNGAPLWPDDSLTVSSVTLRAGALLTPAEAWTVLATVSRGFRAPHMTDLGTLGSRGPASRWRRPTSQTWAERSATPRTRPRSARAFP